MLLSFYQRYVRGNLLKYREIKYIFTTYVPFRLHSLRVMDLFPQGRPMPRPA
jgi:hypothetical protein